MIFILNILEEISFVKNLDINIWYPYFLTLLNLPIKYSSEISKGELVMN